jgi:hypothetical protein
VVLPAASQLCRFEDAGEGEAAVEDEEEGGAGDEEVEEDGGPGNPTLRIILPFR